MSTTVKRYKQLEARVRKGDLDALLARWEFGQALLAERGDKKRLPKGRMEAICNALQLPIASVREFQNRIQFAQQYATEAKVRAAFKKYGSWSEICARGMGDRGTSVQAAFEQLDEAQRAALDFITHPSGEKDDAWAHWAAMPKYGQQDAPRLILTFESDEARHKCVKYLCLNESLTRHATAWSARWPDRPRQNLMTQLYAEREA